MLQWLDESGSLRTSQVSARLGVSVDTVRRDLDELEQAGAVHRVRGGAIGARTTPSSFRHRRDASTGARRLIADLVVARLRPGMAIGLDAGTTSVEIARQLPHDLDLTVVTNGPAALAELAGRTDLTAVSIGGRLDTRWMATTGPGAVAAIGDHRLDLAVVGCCALSSNSVDTDSLDEVSTKRAWIDAAERAVAVADETKLGVTGRHRIAQPGDFDELIVCPTDSSAHRNLIAALEDLTEVTTVTEPVTPSRATTRPNPGKEPSP